MRLPAHADSGTVLRLRGRGVPALGKRAAGDLFATVRVMVGKPDAALEAFVSSWTPEPPLTPRQGMEHL
jgi:DnaJ-class molecular chaperone